MRCSCVVSFVARGQAQPRRGDRQNQRHERQCEAGGHGAPGVACMDKGIDRAGNRRGQQGHKEQPKSGAAGFRLDDALSQGPKARHRGEVAAAKNGATADNA